MNVLATAVLQAWQRPEIDMEAKLSWLQEFTLEPAEPLPMPQRYRRFVNSKNFLRSLYMRAVRSGITNPLRLAIYDTLAPFERFYTSIFYLTGFEFARLHKTSLPDKE